MTLSPDDLAAMGERHRETTRNYDPLGEAPDEQVCTSCDELWPCDSRRLLDELEASERALHYIARPTMGLPAGRDPVEFVDDATEENVRLALKTCIRIATAALPEEVMTQTANEPST